MQSSIKIQESICAKDFQGKYTSKLPESRIQKQIAESLVRLGFLVIRANSGAYNNPEKQRYVRFYTVVNTGQSKGLPDLIVMRNGCSWFLEVKTSKGKLRQSQKDFAKTVEAHGMQVYVVRSVVDALKAVGVKV